MANYHYTWVDLLKILDLEGLHVQMLSLVGIDLRFTWSIEVVYVGCAIVRLSQSTRSRRAPHINVFFVQGP